MEKMVRNSGLRYAAHGRLTPGLALLAGLLLAASSGCAGAPPAHQRPTPERQQPSAADQASPGEGSGTIAPQPAAAPDPAAYEESLGIRIDGVRLTAGDFMLDFRFRVLDAAKAAPLFDRRAKPYLVDEASGGRFLVPNPPKTGPLRTSDPPQQGRVYWMFFANPARYVQRGAPVTIVFGDHTLEHLRVE